MTTLNTTQIHHDGKPVGFRHMPDGEQFIKTRRRIGHQDVCPLCEQIFEKTNVTSVVLVISNQAGIPNRFCHTECFEQHTPDRAFQTIVESYNRFLAARREFQGWLT